MNKRIPRFTRLRPAISAIQKIVRMREKANLTPYGLSSLSGTDDRYLARLEDGTARNPSRDVLMNLAMTLVRYTSLFSRSDVDGVLKAAGYPPSPEHLWCQSCEGIRFGREQ